MIIIILCVSSRQFNNCCKTFWKTDSTSYYIRIYLFLIEASGYNESPIQTKPTLVRSASKKGRVLKSIDFSDGANSNSRVPSATSPTMISPVPPREVRDASNIL